MARGVNPRCEGFSTAVERLFDVGSVVGLSESELLDRFVDRRDGAAFAALVDRHGPMVLGICRRLLHDPHEADDAFQAVFLILARKAGGIGRKELVGNWLYGVSRRVATRARVLAARRPKTGGPLDADARRHDGSSPAESLVRDELGERLHEEVGRLPERYRVPVVACYFEGKSCEEAAALMRCPVGTVKGRLSRARDLLRRRLESRGVTAPAPLLATALAAPDLRAAVPPALAARAVRAGLAASSSPFAWMTASVATTSIHSLAEGVIRAMFYAKLKSLVLPAGLVAAGLLAAGAGLAASQESDLPKPELKKEAKPAADAPSPEPSDAAPAKEESKQASPRPRSMRSPMMGGGMVGMGGMGGMVGGPLVLSDAVFIARASAFLTAQSPTEDEIAVHVALDSKLSIHLGEDSTLADLLEQVRDVKVADGKPLPVFVCWSALRDEEITEVSACGETQLDEVPLKAALRLALKEVGLAYCVRDGILIISTPLDIRVELEEAQAEWLARNPEGYEMGQDGLIRKAEPLPASGRGFQ
jgi:RNA polymerase sigma factor (sigma-70 family)